MSKKIVQKGHEALRRVSSVVPKDDIKSTEVQKVIEKMKRALEEQPDGVAIAAPQVGENLRIFAVSWKVFAVEDGADLSKKEEFEEAKKKNDFKIFINPEIVKSSKKQVWLEEGCLSVRWLYGEVERAEKVRVRALDEKGKPFEFGGSGLMSQIFQHEIDHLDGKLFTDKARNLKEISPDEIGIDKPKT